MRILLHFLYGAVCAAFVVPALANVATTAGSNLTAYNGTGATNNNQWNSLMNGRSGATPAAADANFGNCNAIILRCASPKCGTGCGDANIAYQIVAGCVNTNASCKKHGEDLINYITAQVVAQSTAKAAEQANAVALAQANAAANASAAEQSNAQIQQMQTQMAAMQQQMSESMAAMQQQMVAQTESQNAQIQSALESQRANLYNSPTDTGDTGAVISGMDGLSVAEQLAAKNGISADILVREQMGGKIETSIENAMTAMKDLKAKLDAVLEYAGCDPSATNCTGPKRVKKFKDLANEFFDPYENVVESVYDALILAMTLGIDVNDVIMLLSNSCNMWGRYLCESCSPHETDCGCDSDNKNCFYRVTSNTRKNQKCRLVEVLNENDTVWHEWIDPNTGMMGATQVGCASDVVMSAPIFRGMKKQATLTIDNLRRLVNQDSYSCRGTMNGGEFTFKGDSAVDACGMNMCAVDPNEDSEDYKILYESVRNRKLPKMDRTSKSLCWETFEEAPNQVKNMEPLVISNLTLYPSQTWENTMISKTVGQDFGNETRQDLQETIQNFSKASCSTYTTFSTCFQAGCEWHDPICTQKLKTTLSNYNTIAATYETEINEN